MIPHPAARHSMDVTTSERIANLRREIEGIRELNMLYLTRKHHANQDYVAKEKRQIRLQEIMRQLAALRSNA